MINSTVLAVVPGFLRAVGGVVEYASPGTAIATIVSDVLATAASLVESGEAGASELSALTAHVHDMVAGGATPTADDFAALKARSDAAHATIQGSNTNPL